MIHKSRPIFSTQFHPEAKGGPLDSGYLFDDYLQSVNQYRETQRVLAPAARANGPSLADILGKERVAVTPPIGVANLAAAEAARAQAQPRVAVAA